MQISPIINNFYTALNNKQYDCSKYKSYDNYSRLNADTFELSLNKQVPFCGKKNGTKNIKNTPLYAPKLRFRTVGANYRSACPTSMNIGFPSDVIFQEFRKKGIKTLIDLRIEARENSAYKDEVEKFNRTQTKQNRFTYKHFPIEHNNSKFSDPIIDNEEEKFLKDLGGLIKLMNEGGCNVSCGGGLHRTDLFYCLCYIFNPKDVLPPKLSVALSLESNINFKIYENILNKIKNHFFNKDRKQAFKFPNIEGIRNLTGQDFDDRLKNIKCHNNIGISVK